MIQAKCLQKNISVFTPKNVLAIYSKFIFCKVALLILDVTCVGMELVCVGDGNMSPAHSSCLRRAAIYVTLQNCSSGGRGAVPRGPARQYSQNSVSLSLSPASKDKTRSCMCNICKKLFIIHLSVTTFFSTYKFLNYQCLFQDEHILLAPLMAAMVGI